MLKHCARCGKEFEIKNRFCGSQRYCSSECRNKADRERIKRNNDNRPKKEPQPTKDDGKRCKRYSCLYHPRKEAPNGCDYTLITGKLRGCAPGQGCNCYKRGTAKEKKRLQIENAKKNFYGW